MSVEVALAALGIAGTIAGTLVGAYVNPYFEERREVRKVKAEEWKNVVDEVYSPLMFDLKRLTRGTLLIIGAIADVLAKEPNNYPEEEVAKSIIRFSQFQNQHTQSQILEDILRKKSRLIKPTSLWRDLFTFYSSLRAIEEFFSIISSEYFKKSPARLVAAVNSAAKVGEFLDSAVPYLSGQIGKLVILTAEVPQPQNYTPFFTEAVTAKIDEQIQSIVKALVGG